MPAAACHGQDPYRTLPPARATPTAPERLSGHVELAASREQARMAMEGLS
jgi:hypothetical protein